jgi:GNAT superfamily N-acetyltransferase
MVMLSFRTEDFVEKVPMLQDMFKDHWDELAKNKQLMVLKPFMEAYENMEAAGKLLSIFVYDDSEIVGYSINIITPHLHYADVIMGANDIFFLSKDYRKGTLGLRLIKKTEEEMTLRGVNLVMWHAKENSEFSKILALKKYNVQEIMYSKVLKE